MRLSIKFSASFCAVMALAGCSSSEKNSASFQVVGSYAAHYNAATGDVTYELLSAEKKLAQEGKSYSSVNKSSKFLLDYTDSTGLSGSTVDPYGCAIRDYSKSPGTQNWCMALVDPDNCSTDYNTTTKTLSFYARLKNVSNNAENPTTFHYTDTTNFPANTTFFSPFYFKLTGLDFNNTSYPGLITAVNTNISTAECGASGLSLTNDDDNTNGYFDCIYPEQAFSSTDTPVDPGWDFTPYVTGGDMTPGEDTGCVLFMQYTLTQNQNITIYFDVLANKSDGTPPSTPTVTSPTDNSYSNASPITVTGTCTTGSTVYVEGGADTTVPSGTCVASAYSISGVDLKPNQVNTLSVYQVVSGEQSQATVRTVTHDDVAPSVVTWSPASGETVVGLNTRCVATFSEPMDTTTFNVGTGTGAGSCNSGNFLMCRGTRRIGGATTFSADRTQAVYTPSAALANANTAHTCNAKTASGAPTTLRDLAGNALSPTSTITFTSGTAGQDLTLPYVKSIIPGDNATVSVSTSFYITFSEPVATSTLSATNCSTGGTIPNIAVWQTNSCVVSGYPTSRPNAIAGTISVNADGDIVTFTPSSGLSASDCLSVTVGRCVTDLAGNQLSDRGNFDIAAYANDNLTYNAWNIFYTKSTSDSTAPTLAFVAPTLNATSALRRVFPLVIFDEPIDADTVIGDYLYMTVFGSSAKLALSLKQDTSLQVVQYKPSSDLAASTNHVITVTGNVTDASGNLMAAPQTSNFTTTSSTDSTAPTVVKVTPTNGSSASRCTTFEVDFSEPMDTTTLNGANITLVNVGTGAVKPIDIDVADDGQSVKLTPQSSLAGGCGTNNCRYRPTISTGVKDRQGNAMAATYNATTVTAITDGTAPTVSFFVPASGATVANNSSLLAYFSEPMDRSTMTNGNFTFPSGCSSGFRGVFPSEDGRWAVVNCYNNMNSGASRSLSVSTSVKDRYVGSDAANCENNAGNAIASTQTVSFTVSATSDTTAPTVSSVSPTDLSTSVSTAVAPAITFSEAIDPRTISPTSVFLVDQQGNVVNTTLSFNTTATVITLTPEQALTNPGVYYIIATTALRDLGGGLPYDGLGGESTPASGILRACFSTSATSCP